MIRRTCFYGLLSLAVNLDARIEIFLCAGVATKSVDVVSFGR